MDNLNWVFSLYAVVLGLTLAEILTGFSRSISLRRDAALDGRDDVRLGILSPLLALFLMLDITSFWIVAWTLQGAIVVTPLTLAFGLFTTGFYYVAGSWVFPDAAERAFDLDVHYYRQKSAIFGLIFLSNLTTYLGRSLVTGSIELPGFERYDYAVFGLYYVLQLAGIVVTGKKANIAVLAGLLLLSLDFILGVGSRLISVFSNV